ncbi:MAG: type IV pilus modification PilV family protein [Planctomycetota bacterium]|jgi:hypothetical protein
MGKARRHCGFSLLEVLLAVGTLAVGMIFIGGTYLVGVHLAGVSAERTTGTIVANEAFAKIRLFGVNMMDPNLDPNYSTSYRFEAPTQHPFTYDEFAYPSWGDPTNKQYFWSAVCRQDPNDRRRDLQVTVFVSRKIGASTLYAFPPTPANLAGRVGGWPVVMRVPVSGTPGVDILTILDDPGTMFDERQWIGAGYTIVEDSTGDIYRVLKRAEDPTRPDDVIIDRLWDPRGMYPSPNSVVWVVPPPVKRNDPSVSRGRGPCIGVYQGKITFNELQVP